MLSSYKREEFADSGIFKQPGSCCGLFSFWCLDLLNSIIGPIMGMDLVSVIVTACE